MINCLISKINNIVANGYWESDPEGVDFFDYEGFKEETKFVKGDIEYLFIGVEPQEKTNFIKLVQKEREKNANNAFWISLRIIENENLYWLIEKAEKLEVVWINFSYNLKINDEIIHSKDWVEVTTLKL